jgi:hypothetical protein
MAQKNKTNDLKKYLAEMSEEALRSEILKLYQKLSQVKDFYNQDLMNDAERQTMLDAYKKKIYRHFWTPSGNPKDPRNAEIKALVSEFEKVAAFPYDVIDLLLYRVELTTEHANEYGGAADANYNSSTTMFIKAMKLIQTNGYIAHFKERIENLFDYDNLDGWYIQDLQDVYQEYQN